MTRRRGVEESRPWVGDDMVPEPSLVGSAGGRGERRPLGRVRISVSGRIVHKSCGRRQVRLWTDFGKLDRRHRTISPAWSRLARRADGMTIANRAAADRQTVQVSKTLPPISI